MCKATLNALSGACRTICWLSPTPPESITETLQTKCSAGNSDASLYRTMKSICSSLMSFDFKNWRMRNSLSIWWKKTTDRITSTKLKGNNDWVAIFWKSSTFDWVGTWSIEFGRYNTNSYIYDKPQVACFVALKVEREIEEKIIIVWTTHILYNTNRGDIKLAQIDLITQWIANIKWYIETCYPKYDISTIIAGDFNSPPNSGIYQYMSKGEYDWASQNRNEISGQMYNSRRTEKEFKRAISVILPNPKANVIKLPHWYLEITNTAVSIKSKHNKNCVFQFTTKGSLSDLMRKAGRMERELYSHRRHKSTGRYQSKGRNQTDSDGSEEEKESQPNQDFLLKSHW